MPEPTEKPRRGLPLGLPCLSPLYFCSIFEGLHRTIRPKIKIFSCMRSASVDLVKSRLSLVDFSSGLAVPSENIDFQHLETQKIQLFQTFSNFSRHGSCGYATKVQKQHKIRIWPLSVHCATQLRVPADRTALSLNCFFPNKCAKLDVRSWSKSVRTTESIRKFNFSIKTYINEHYKVVLHERTTQVHYFKIFRFHMKFSSVHP